MGSGASEWKGRRGDRREGIRSGCWERNTPGTINWEDNTGFDAGEVLLAGGWELRWLRWLKGKAIETCVQLIAASTGDESTSQERKAGKQGALRWHSTGSLDDWYASV